MGRYNRHTHQKKILKPVWQQYEKGERKNAEAKILKNEHHRWTCLWINRNWQTDSLTDNRQLIYSRKSNPRLLHTDRHIDTHIDTTNHIFALCVWCLLFIPAPHSSPTWNNSATFFLNLERSRQNRLCVSCVCVFKCDRTLVQAFLPCSPKPQSPILFFMLVDRKLVRKRLMVEFVLFTINNINIDFFFFVVFDVTGGGGKRAAVCLCVC